MLHLCRECITEFAAVAEETFRTRRVYQTSLAWYLQAVGEAASRISDEARAKLPAVPWKQIVGTRHILSHEYDRLLPEKLWRILRAHLPRLLDELEKGIDNLRDETTAPFRKTPES